jgi:mono/diheme cytochrome c family protein
MIALIGLIFPPSVAADGGELYQRRCSSCHGADGKGDTAIGKKKGLRPLGSPEVQALTDSELASKIAEGGAEGDRQHAFRDKGLSDEDVSEIVIFVRALARRK